MKQLIQSGFMLDNDTKQYVSQYIWDQIASLNTEYYNMEKQGMLDYYVLGNGDFNTGREIGMEIKQAHYDMVNYWKSLYYDKLWSDEMRAGVAQYRRNNTTYLQDANGNWYATGFTPTPFMPFMIGDEPTEGDGWKPVLGADENWETQSIVTGNRTGERSLVPIEIGYVETPNIESWSIDGTDTGHSAAYKDSSNSATTNATTTTKTTSTRGGYGGGGYGGYGFRRFGGGGRRGYSSSGGSPNIYAPSVGALRGTPSRIMNTDRIQEENLDYLRPDFETKGSREAYRRSDI
jgi:hypothetical protein